MPVKDKLPSQRPASQRDVAIPEVPQANKGFIISDVFGRRSKMTANTRRIFFVALARKKKSSEPEPEPEKIAENDEERRKRNRARVEKGRPEAVSVRRGSGRHEMDREIQEQFGFQTWIDAIKAEEEKKKKGRK